MQCRGALGITNYELHADIPVHNVTCKERKGNVRKVSNFSNAKDDLHSLLII
jgi:hypothetical protein